MAKFVCPKLKSPTDIAPERRAYFMPNTMLKLWENYTPRKSDQLTNVGASWVIDPTGPIVEPTECINATSAPGILKIYRDFHPDCLVIHWMFPNIHVGHVLWISQAPITLTDFQIATVRGIENQLRRDWEHVIRWEIIMTPPPFRFSLGPREVHSSTFSPHCQPWPRSNRSTRTAFTCHHRTLCRYARKASA